MFVTVTVLSNWTIFSWFLTTVGVVVGKVGGTGYVDF